MSFFGETTPAPGLQPTYVACSPVFNPSGAAGVIAVLSGTAGKKIQILKAVVNFSCTETGQPINWSLARCSSAPSGGSGGALVLTSLNGSNPASAASGSYFSTPATAAGILGRVGALITGMAGAGGTLGFGAQNGSFTAGSVPNPLVPFEADKFGGALVLNSASEHAQLLMETALSGITGTPLMQVHFVYSEL